MSILKQLKTLRELADDMVKLTGDVIERLSISAEICENGEFTDPIDEKDISKCMQSARRGEKEFFAFVKSEMQRQQMNDFVKSLHRNRTQPSTSSECHSSDLKTKTPAEPLKTR